MEKRVDHDNADSQDEWEPLAKQTKVDNTCIIHCSDNPGKIVLVDSLDKWNDLVTAATNLDNENIMEIARVTPVGSIPPNVVTKTAGMSFFYGANEQRKNLNLNYKCRTPISPLRRNLPELGVFRPVNYFFPKSVFSAAKPINTRKERK